MNNDFDSKESHASYGAGDSTQTEYSTPDGGHGMVYTPKPSAGAGRASPRGWVIALAAVALTVLLMGGCLLGVFIVARLVVTPDIGGDDRTDAEAQTSDGLYINGDESGFVETSPNGQPIDDDLRDAQAAEGTAPLNASIEKRDPQRQDANGDGKADVETDDAGRVLTSAGANATTIPTVVARVEDAVVEISTETLVQSGRVGQYITSGAGSGVIISEEGFIVTNHHVIDGADTIVVRLTDGTKYEATLIGSDEQTDVAVLWIDAVGRDLTVAPLGASFDLVVGEDIIAIGNPLGSLGGTVTEGIVSATARTITVDHVDMTLLQISAPINPGNSGGGLFNLAGELVGIVNAKYSSEEIEGLSFAIPIDTAYAVILELIDHGYVKGRPALDATLVDVTNVQSALYYFGSRYTGVYIWESNVNDIKKGDLILTVDGTEVTSVSEVQTIISGKRVGDTVELVVYRSSTKKQITVTLPLAEYVPAVTEPAA